MPDQTPPPADGQQGTDAGTNSTTQAQGAEAGSKTFTQADVDRILQDRLARAVPADYEANKEAAAELAKLKEKDKSDLDRATERAATAEKASEQSQTELKREKLERAIEREAFAQDADADLVALALASSSDITVDKDGKIDGVKAAVEALLKSKPHLKIGSGRASGGEFGGTDNPTLTEQIAALEAKGDRESRAKARELKIEQMQAMTA